MLLTLFCVSLRSCSPPLWRGVCVREQQPRAAGAGKHQTQVCCSWCAPALSPATLSTPLYLRIESIGHVLLLPNVDSCCWCHGILWAAH